MRYVHKYNIVMYVSILTNCTNITYIIILVMYISFFMRYNVTVTLHIFFVTGV